MSFSWSPRFDSSIAITFMTVKHVLFSGYGYLKRFIEKRLILCRQAEVLKNFHKYQKAMVYGVKKDIKRKQFGTRHGST